MIGEILCSIKYEDLVLDHKFLIAKGNKINLFGRDLLAKFNFHVVKKSPQVNSVHNSIIDEFNDYLCDDYKSCINESVELNMPDDIKPVYMKARQVPLRLKDKLKNELDRLVAMGVLTPVYSSEWATPVVTVYKQDGSIRLCADFSCTVNKYLNPIHTPLITVDEAISSVGNAKIFSKIDLSQAFLQIPVHENSQKFLVINTSEGLFKFSHLPFGLTCSSGIFQAFISRILDNIPGVLCYQDDILVMSKDVQSHNEILRTVLNKLKQTGLKLNVRKCKFFTDRVEYLGYVFSSAGVHPRSSKVNEIVDAPMPKDMKQVQSFIGLCNYYSRFIPHFASKMAPFYALMQKPSKFQWTNIHQQAFDDIKSSFVECKILQHFDPNSQTCLETDSSSYGIGCVLLQRKSDSTQWLPVQFASRTLNSAEKNYSQLEKEALSIIYGVEKFKHFLLGSPFIIKNDHKPLKTLFAKDKPIPSTCSSRVLRWALKLSQFDYQLNFSCGKDNVQSDFLSRFPLPETVPESEPYELVFALNKLTSQIIDYKTVAEHTLIDPDLSLLMCYIKQGCPNKIKNKELSNFKSFIPFMTICKGCILFKDRVFLPSALRQDFLVKLHATHPGMVAMKTWARELVWYPGIDQDIQYLVSNCPNCQVNRARPPQNSFESWPTPTRPWSRVHLDHFFFDNVTFLIVVDAASHYIEVEIVKNTSVDETLDALRIIFSRNGLPDVICSDNASCFTSYAFNEFIKENGMEHVTSPPFCPSSNGLAERGVRVIKDLLKKLGNSNKTVKSRLAQVLLYQRTVPHSLTQVAPSLVLNGRKYLNAHDKVHPKYSNALAQKNHSSKKMAQFEIGEEVLAINMARGPKWMKAKIVQKLAINVYYVFVPQLGLNWKRHVTQLAKILSKPNDKLDMPESVESPHRECIDVRPKRNRNVPIRFGYE